MTWPEEYVDIHFLSFNGMHDRINCFGNLVGRNFGADGTVPPKYRPSNKDCIPLPSSETLNVGAGTCGILYRAMLRYYRCDTPYRAILFKGGGHSPKSVRYPPSLLSFTQAHQCDTPFCNVSRDNVWYPHENKHKKVLRYYRYKYRAIWIRKILVSVKFLSAILGPEMAAPILWTPGKKRPCCRKNHVHKIPPFRGGGILGFGGGGKCRFYFYGREDFSEWRVLLLGLLGCGGTGRKRKGFCTKPCAWRKHGLCDTRLAEAQEPLNGGVSCHTLCEINAPQASFAH